MFLIVGPRVYYRKKLFYLTIKYFQNHVHVILRTGVVCVMWPWPLSWLAYPWIFNPILLHTNVSVDAEWGYGITLLIIHIFCSFKIWIKLGWFSFPLYSSRLMTVNRRLHLAAYIRTYCQQLSNDFFKNKLVTGPASLRFISTGWFLLYQVIIIQMFRTVTRHIQLGITHMILLFFIYNMVAESIVPVKKHMITEFKICAYLCGIFVHVS